MSAHPVPSIPVLRSLLDEHFDLRELSRALGLEDLKGLELARRVLHPPVADMVSRPGKEVRARLVEHAFAIASAASPCECAHLPPELPQLVEMLHAGSLVVDDIEDEATHRRGAPALHRTWGVPIALNAGNWMYFWPLFVMGSLPVDRSTATSLFRRTAQTLLRCHQGQALDLALRVDALAQDEIASAVDATTRLKTGSLLALSCSLGAIAAHASPMVETALSNFGREVGVALQMFDDLSGIVSPARRAKGNEDLSASRPTWVWAWLAADLDAHSFRTLQRAPLETIRTHITPKIRKRPREQLDRAIHELRAAIPNVSMQSLERDVRTLEHAYV
jgi:geranylgeranyl pyrophosphate synthase